MNGDDAVVHFGLLECVGTGLPGLLLEVTVLIRNPLRV